MHVRRRYDDPLPILISAIILYMLYIVLFQSLFTIVQVHNRFVNIVRFSPDGELFCSGGADCKAFLFNGKTAESVGSLGGDKAHAGGIYGVSVSFVFL